MRAPRGRAARARSLELDVTAPLEPTRSRSSRWSRSPARSTSRRGADPRRADLQPRPGEVAQLFALMRRLKDDGIAIVFVSHFLDQVYEIADRMTVLRNGRGSASGRRRSSATSSWSRKMLGREARDARGARGAARGRRSALEARRRSSAAEAAGPHRRDRALRPGHPPGRGRRPRRPARLRAAPSSPGCCSAPTGPTPAGLDGEPAMRNPRVAMAHGIAFCPENRRTEGLVGSSPCARTSSWRCRPPAAGRGRPAPAPGRARRARGSRRWASAPPTPSRPCATSAAATSRRCCSRAG